MQNGAEMERNTPLHFTISPPPQKKKEKKKKNALSSSRNHCPQIASWKKVSECECFLHDSLPHFGRVAQHTQELDWVSLRTSAEEKR